MVVESLAGKMAHESDRTGLSSQNGAHSSDFVAVLEEQSTNLLICGALRFW
jgi:hypothetical protein